MLPPLRDLLDPRPMAQVRQRPMVEAVAIPASELRFRLSELPSAKHVVRIANVDGAQEALEFLRSGGRRARLAVDFAYGVASPGRLWSPHPWVLHRPGPGRALDLGCGAGREAVALAAHGWTVTAVDHLPEALERARRLENSALAHPRVQWQHGDARERWGEEFDLVLAIRLHSVEAVTQAWSQVRSGGHLILEWQAHVGPAPQWPRDARGGRCLRTPVATRWEARRP